jgi:hypothetical protein
VTVALQSPLAGSRTIGTRASSQPVKSPTTAMRRAVGARITSCTVTGAASPVLAASVAPEGGVPACVLPGAGAASGAVGAAGSPARLPVRREMPTPIARLAASAPASSERVWSV